MTTTEEPTTATTTPDIGEKVELIIGRRRYHFTRDKSGRWSHNRPEAAVMSVLTDSQKEGRRGDALVWALNNQMITTEDQLRGLNRAFSRGLKRPAPQYLWTHLALLVYAGMSQEQASALTRGVFPWQPCKKGALGLRSNYPEVESVPSSRDAIIAGLEGVAEAIGRAPSREHTDAYMSVATLMADLVLMSSAMEECTDLSLVEAMLAPAQSLLVNSKAGIGLVTALDRLTSDPGYLTRVILSKRMPPAFGLRTAAARIAWKESVYIEEIEALGRTFPLWITQRRFLGNPSEEYLQTVKTAVFGPRYENTPIPWVVLTALSKNFGADIDTEWMKMAVEHGPGGECSDLAREVFGELWGDDAYAWRNLFA